MLEWINIPAGRVTLETAWTGQEWEDSKGYDREPLGSLDVAPFAITKYPVTNAQFQAFVDDNGYQDGQWWQDLAQWIKTPKEPEWSEPTHPRDTVSWYEAVAFSRWLAYKTGLPVTLPTEIQWQWAAVGDTGWDYHYGSAFDKNLCNTYESGINKSTPVNFYDDRMQGKTRFGVMDMCGNISEWCLNLYDNPLSCETTSAKLRPRRGGNWLSIRVNARASFRDRGFPDSSHWCLGFRVVSSVQPSS